MPTRSQAHGFAASGQRRCRLVALLWNPSSTGSAWSSELQTSIRREMRRHNIGPSMDAVTLRLLRWTYERRFFAPSFGDGSVRLIMMTPIGPHSPVSIWHSGSVWAERLPVIQIHFEDDRRFESNEAFRVGLGFVSSTRRDRIRSRVVKALAPYRMSDSGAPEIRFADLVDEDCLERVISAIDRSLFKPLPST